MTKKYKIVADENMLGIEQLFSDIADITFFNGREISAKNLINADALLCRSITQVNTSLLADSQVKFVGTATIGIDHLDTGWLDKNQIKWSNAAGCNAPAVGQYVLSAVAYWCLQNNKAMKNLTIGIIGAGNVGSILAQYLDFYGISYKLCDPPLQEQGDPRGLVGFSEVIGCDVITLHVPMIKNGRYSTHYLMSKPVLEKLNQQQLLINASRGAVIHNQDLNEYLKKADSASCILDVYENEPDICLSLTASCLLATPHIAGHTLEGKLRGSWMVYAAFCKAFALPLVKTETDLYPPNNQIDLSNLSFEQNLLNIYDISSDSNSLKSIEERELAVKFDQLRKEATKLSNGYIRRDYSGWTIDNEASLFECPPS